MAAAGRPPWRAVVFAAGVLWPCRRAHGAARGRPGEASAEECWPRSWIGRVASAIRSPSPSSSATVRPGLLRRATSPAPSARWTWCGPIPRPPTSSCGRPTVRARSGSSGASSAMRPAWWHRHGPASSPSPRTSSPARRCSIASPTPPRTRRRAGNGTPLDAALDARRQAHHRRRGRRVAPGGRAPTVGLDRRGRAPRLARCAGAVRPGARRAPWAPGQRLHLDIQYIRSMSLRTDLGILAATVGSVTRSRGGWRGMGERRAGISPRSGPGWAGWAAPTVLAGGRWPPDATGGGRLDRGGGGSGRASR